ncbi:MAG: hypothetical protein H6Q14_2681 [Bacteroidetes bacterium]|nr:hypothetical protein [Bacteroidota bacterium]
MLEGSGIWLLGVGSACIVAKTKTCWLEVFLRRYWDEYLQKDIMRIVKSKSSSSFSNKTQTELVGGDLAPLIFNSNRPCGESTKITSSLVHFCFGDTFSVFYKEDTSCLNLVSPIFKLYSKLRSRVQDCT